MSRPLQAFGAFTKHPSLREEKHEPYGEGGILVTRAASPKGGANKLVPIVDYDASQGRPSEDGPTISGGTLAGPATGPRLRNRKFSWKVCLGLMSR
jgi:hypothetical protein